MHVREMFAFDENKSIVELYKGLFWSLKEIGIGFLLASLTLFVLGIVFIFDRALIIMGNVRMGW